jgi:glycerate-2-kinase
MATDGEILASLFKSALDAALPDGKFDDILPAQPSGRTIIIGAGKGSARMAAAFEAAWRHPCEGLIVTRYGHGAKTKYIEIVEAAHPVPDQAGLNAAERILALAQSAGPDDLVVCLMSGGASALLSLPAPGITLADKQAINKALLKSGAPIGEMNLVRKSLSAIKGGRLAAAIAPAKLVTYLISDVPGDDPAAIGSGPTIPEASDPERALAILAQYNIAIEPRIEQAIRNNIITDENAGGETHMLATPRMALDAAAEKAHSFGLETRILGDAIEGEARKVAELMALIVTSVEEHDTPAKRPCVLLSGGETTVTVKGNGRGGRNAEFLLALLLALGKRPGISAIACDTDGIDGMETNAGAWFDETLLDRAEAAGLSGLAYLDNNDAYSFFDALGQLVVTGPTLTNVNDFRAIIIR